MSRGLRKDTLDRIAQAREHKPLSLGPYLGDLTVRANISASTVADIIGSHEQTVFRWFFGQGEVQPVWGAKVARLVALLAWMHSSKLVPLEGTIRDREKQLQIYAAQYTALAKGGVRLKLEA
jgi:hypothetical protein